MECGGVAKDVLQLSDIETPEPGEGEVRVKVAYSAVNPFDIKRRVNGRDLANWKRVIPHLPFQTPQIPPLAHPNAEQSFRFSQATPLMEGSSLGHSQSPVRMLHLPPF